MHTIFSNGYVFIPHTLLVPLLPSLPLSFSSPTPLALSLFNVNRQAGEPALENGFIPYLGCALQFGANPLHFLRSRQNKYGHIFTCKIAGKFIHFLCDPFSYHSVIRQGRHLDWRKFHFATSVKVNKCVLILYSYISFDLSSTFLNIFFVFRHLVMTALTLAMATPQRTSIRPS